MNIMKPILMYLRIRKHHLVGLLAVLWLSCAALAASAVMLDAPVTAQDSGTTGSTQPVVTSVTLKATGLEVSWDAPSVSLDVSTYSVFRSATDVESRYETVVEGLDGSTTTYLDTLEGVPMGRLTSPIVWYYKVSAVLDQGTGQTFPGGKSEGFGINVVLPKPGGPTSGGSRNIGNGSYTFHVAWTAPTLSWSNNGLGVTGYAVYVVEFDRPNYRFSQKKVVAETEASVRAYSQSWNWHSHFRSLVEHRFSVRAKYGIFFSGETGFVSTPFTRSDSHDEGDAHDD